MAERCASIFFDGGINPTPHLGNIHVHPGQPILELSIVINLVNVVADIEKLKY